MISYTDIFSKLLRKSGYRYWWSEFQGIRVTFNVYKIFSGLQGEKKRHLAFFFPLLRLKPAVTLLQEI